MPAAAALCSAGKFTYGRGDVGVKLVRAPLVRFEQVRNLITKRAQDALLLEAPQPTDPNLEDHLADVDQNIGHRPQMVRECRSTIPLGRAHGKPAGSGRVHSGAGPPGPITIAW